MPTTRPFAYNTGGAITGTFQIGNIAVGTSSQDYSQQPGGVTWWMGPDEDLGYIIAKPTPGSTANLGFSRSLSLTDESFVGLVNQLSITGTTLTGGTQAKTVLNENGYWTSWVSQEVDFGIDSSYESGSTIATYTITTSEVVDTDLEVSFKNTLFDTNGNELPINVSLTIEAGRNTRTTTVTTDYDYDNIQGYETSFSEFRTFGSDVKVNTISKYDSVTFNGKNKSRVTELCF